jgi:hypothetical protein
LVQQSVQLWRQLAQEPRMQGVRVQVKMQVGRQLADLQMQLRLVPVHLPQVRMQARGRLVQTPPLLHLTKASRLAPGLLGRGPIVAASASAGVGDSAAMIRIMIPAVVRIQASKGDSQWDAFCDRQ